MADEAETAGDGIYNTGDNLRIFKCKVCGYVYDEDTESVTWEDLPDDWDCPACGSAKSYFETA